MKLGETSTDIPIELCELHQLTAGMRIDIEKNIDNLADDIRRHKQMQPGRVILAPGGKYLVYMGSRRFLGCKLLFDDKGKLKTYKAFIDDDLSDEEIIERALAENATEKKGRLDVRLLEELHYFAALLPTHPLEQIRAIALAGGMKKESLKKKFELLDFLTADDAERLYRVEEETGYRFDPDLLKGIWQFSNGDKSIFLGACARAAKKEDWTVKGLNEDLVLGSAPEALKIPWFSKIFPNVVPTTVPEKEEGGGGEEDPLGGFVKNTMKKKGTRVPPKTNSLEETNDSYYYIPCKNCTFEIPIDCDLQMKGRPAVTAYKFKDDGHLDGNRTELGATFAGRMKCPNCSNWWKLVLSPAGKEKMRISLEDTPQEEEVEEASGDVVESAETNYSPVFNQFIFVDHGKWYFYDAELGRRRPISNEEIEKHKSYFRSLLSPTSDTTEKPASESPAVADTTETSEISTS